MEIKLAKLALVAGGRPSRAGGTRVLEFVATTLQVEGKVPHAVCYYDSEFATPSEPLL